MQRRNVIRIVAGSLVMISIALGWLLHPLWLLLGLFVGANLFQYGFTNWCLMDRLLQRLGLHD